MSDWIDWNGGERPVDEDVWIEVMLCDGQSDGYKTNGQGKDFYWAYMDSGCAIVKYRVIDNPTDMVNSPPHYQLLPGVEVYDVREAMLDKVPEGVPFSQVDDWSRATEYLMRMWQKNGIEDAKKARWYLNKLIEKMDVLFPG